MSVHTKDYIFEFLSVFIRVIRGALGLRLCRAAISVVWIRNGLSRPLTTAIV
jgi:hypothetical protein